MSDKSFEKMNTLYFQQALIKPICGDHGDFTVLQNSKMISLTQSHNFYFIFFIQESLKYSNTVTFWYMGNIWLVLLKRNLGLK